MREGDDTSGSSARPGLSQESILDAAIGLIDSEGLASLSMRRLGTALGVEAMALYRYVVNRDGLIDGVVERVVEQMYADPLVLLQPGDSWRDYLRRVAGGVRRIALAHPRLFPLIATRPPSAPWVRPPLRSLGWVDSFLTGLQARGFSDEDVVYVYRAFTSFLLGHLLLEVSGRGIETTVGSDGASPAQPADLSGYPSVLRLAPKLAQDRSEEEFLASLENVMDRLAEHTGVAG